VTVQITYEQQRSEVRQRSGADHYKMVTDRGRSVALAAAEPAPGHEARFAMLESVHAYPLEQLVAHHELGETRCAHADCFLELCGTATPRRTVFLQPRVRVAKKTTWSADCGSVRQHPHGWTRRRRLTAEQALSYAIAERIRSRPGRGCAFATVLSASYAAHRLTPAPARYSLERARAVCAGQLIPRASAPLAAIAQQQREHRTQRGRPSCRRDWRRCRLDRRG
jgi:hypothetical protein